ncbi:hypothetical protein K0U00_44575, partial [Paenibacillus sepulcri]|nr:hypothetical protein [Paenibacillus sepulcri]
MIAPGIWENEEVRLTLLQDDERSSLLAPGEEAVYRFSVVLTRCGEECPPGSLADWEKRTEDVWRERIERMCGSVPRLESDIPGLDDYYNRSLASGLVCLWEHPDFAMSPFPVVSGMEGAGVCCYPWDTGGYAGRMLAMMIGSGKMIELATLMANSGIESHSRFSPSGAGKDVPYSYNMWSFFNLVWSNMQQNGEGRQLYGTMHRLLLSEEERFPARWEL